MSDNSKYKGKGIVKQDILQINISLVIVILIFMLGVFKDIFMTNTDVNSKIIINESLFLSFFFFLSSLFSFLVSVFLLIIDRYFYLVKIYTCASIITILISIVLMVHEWFGTVLTIFIAVPVLILIIDILLASLPFSYKFINKNKNKL